MTTTTKSVVAPEARMLYAAVLADPAEDGPRLALADWLQENGHVELGRYVAWAVGHERKDRIFPAEAPALVDVYFDNNWVHHHTGRFEEFPGLRRIVLADAERGVCWATERGFVSGLVCEYRVWNLHHDRFRETHPITWVAFAAEVTGVIGDDQVELELEHFWSKACPGVHFELLDSGSSMRYFPLNWL